MINDKGDNMKVSKKKIYSNILIILLFLVVFLTFPYLNNNRAFRYLLVTLIGILIFPRSIYIFRKIDKKILFFEMFYVIVVIISGFINKDSHIITHTFVSALVYGITIIETTLVLKYVQVKCGGDYILETIFKILLFVVILNDFFVLVNPSLFFRNGIRYYFIGNKFSVAYRHVELFVLMLYKQYKENNKIKSKMNVPLLCVYLVLCIIVFNQLEGGSGGSGTGIAALIIVILLNLIPCSFLSNSYLYMVVAICATLFTSFFDVVLSLNPVKTFVTDILNKDLTLTGRINIYKFLPNVLEDHILFGYGHGSSNETWMNFTRIYPNSQNGFVDCIVEQGIIATGLIVVIVMLSITGFRNAKKTNMRYFPILILIYTYTIISCVEVTISIVFVWWVILFFILNTQCTNRLNQ